MITREKMQPGETQYFRFESDFVEQHLRCIPMIVRFKLDACGVKLKLAEWSRFQEKERKILATMPCSSQEEIDQYRSFLKLLILTRTGNAASLCQIEEFPAWADTTQVLPSLSAIAIDTGFSISLSQWTALNNLQRFALIKLCRPGHENANFPRAMKEFGFNGKEN